MDGIELAQRTRRRVARVEIGLLACFFEFRWFSCFEFLDGDKGFAAHDQISEGDDVGDTQACRARPHSDLDRDLQRNRSHRPQIGSDILAHLPIAACGALHEDAVAVMQHDGQAVDLRLDHELRLFDAVIQFADAFEPGARILRAEGIGQAEDRRGVAHLFETVGRDLLRRAGWANRT